MSPRHLTTLFAGAAFVVASLADPAAFAQTFTPSVGATPPPLTAPSPTNGQPSFFTPGPLGSNVPVPVGPTPTLAISPTRAVAPPSAPSVGFGYVANPNAPLPVMSTLIIVPSPAMLKQSIAAAARTVAASPGFASLSAAQKTALIQAAIARLLSSSGASPAVIGAALIEAVTDNSISDAMAVAVATAVSPGLGAQVAAAQTFTPTVVAPTASTSAAPSISILTSLQTTSSTGTTGTTPTPTPPPAPFDPCAGVIAAYCGG
jgi:hypothetical protein